MAVSQAPGQGSKVHQVRGISGFLPGAIMPLRGSSGHAHLILLDGAKVLRNLPLSSVTSWPSSSLQGLLGVGLFSPLNTRQLGYKPSRIHHSTPAECKDRHTRLSWGAGMPQCVQTYPQESGFGHFMSHCAVALVSGFLIGHVLTAPPSSCRGHWGCAGLSLHPGLLPSHKDVWGLGPGCPTAQETGNSTFLQPGTQPAG